MTRSSAGFIARAFAALFFTGVPALLGASLPAAAGAYATVAPPPTPSTSSGLPDGRVYELASPANKHGYQAGALVREGERVHIEFSIASQDGNAVAYGAKGPAAETDSSGVNVNFVAERTNHGWISRSTTARSMRLNEESVLELGLPTWRDYTPDLSHMAYEMEKGQVAGAPRNGPRNFYLLGSDPLEAPTWLLKEGGPLQSESSKGYELVGMSPDASIIYIALNEPLLPQDASRSGWGLYEYRNGKLSEAGVLPDGSVPASGARPPATAVPVSAERTGQNNPASLDNQLSEDGKRVLFVSSGELYVHRIEPDGSERSVLVSASELPGHVGEAAPDGVALFENLTKNAGTPNVSGPTYAYASPDGSHIFFQSADVLSSSAPGGTALKVYDFDVDAETLTYLPGVTLGGIVTAAKDGSTFAFVSGTSSPPELDLWSAGPDGGSVSQIAQLPGGGFVGPGRMVGGDSVLVFQAAASIAGFNNAASEQIYRYDIESNELSCLSCPPAGVTPSGNSYLSAIDQYSKLGPYITDKAVNDARGVSSDGDRIFFASPDPLVSRDTNGDFDTYEWEDGKVFLISSGTSSDYSLFLDNSESGGDVFFTTSDELVEGDTDGGFDVYDARIPRPGDNPPPAAVPCSGNVCQGPPSVAQLLGAPPSASFNGAGNVVEEHAAISTKGKPKRLSKAQKRANALRACRKIGPKRRQGACEKRAQKRYPAAGAASKRGNGRGK